MKKTHYLFILASMPLLLVGCGPTIYESNTIFCKAIDNETRIELDFPVTILYDSRGGDVTFKFHEEDTIEEFEQFLDSSKNIQYEKREGYFEGKVNRFNYLLTINNQDFIDYALIEVPIDYKNEGCLMFNCAYYYNGIYCLVPYPLIKSWENVYSFFDNEETDFETDYSYYDFKEFYYQTRQLNISFNDEEETFTIANMFELSIKENKVIRTHIN